MMTSTTKTISQATATAAVVTSGRTATTMTSGGRNTAMVTSGGRRSVRAGCLGMAVFVAVVCVSLVPSVHAASLSRTLGYGYQPDLDLAGEGDPYSSTITASKRNKGVDAWSICPPQMTDVDCFYAYLRVYARLRKAAEESDRVSMRNIGKRGSSLTSSLSSSSLSPSSSSSSTSSSQSEREMSRLRRLPLCLDDMPPALCYLSAMHLYRRVLDNNINSRL